MPTSAANDFSAGTTSYYGPVPVTFQPPSLEAVQEQLSSLDSALGFSLVDAQQQYMNGLVTSGMIDELNVMHISTQSQLTRNVTDPRSSLFSEYSHKLGVSYEYVRHNNLGGAASTIIAFVQWLFDHIEDLGLTKDLPWLAEKKSEQAALRKWRLKFWADFNNCWLALLQRHQQNADQVPRPNQAPISDSSVLSRARLEALGNTMVWFCDEMHPKGLVDYEIGVWEEQILEFLTKCWLDAAREEQFDSLSKPLAPDWQSPGNRYERRQH